MLKWYEENGKHLGFDDDTFLYRVAQDENGWYYEYIPDADGMDGYETAEEAKTAAEEEFSANQFGNDWDEDTLLDILDDEGEWDTYWDAIAHERMEIAKGLC